MYEYMKDFRKKIKRGNKTSNGYFVSVDLMWIFEDEKNLFWSERSQGCGVFLEYKSASVKSLYR
jgi:hypothetical protein